MKNFIFYSLLLFCYSACQNINNQNLQSNISQDNILLNVQSLEFSNLISSNEGIIIDVRTPSEFSSGHIEEATNIDFYSNDFMEKLKIVRKDVPIYLYCRSGGRSSSAMKKMRELGFSEIYNLIGGISAWKSHDYPLAESEIFITIKNKKFQEKELNDILQNNDMVLLNFSTEWCVPCRKMNPIIKEIEIDYTDLRVLFIDADVNKFLFEKYKVQAVPSQILYNNGNEIFRNVGIISKENLVSQL